MTNCVPTNSLKVFDPNWKKAKIQGIEKPSIPAVATQNNRLNFLNTLGYFCETVDHLPIPTFVVIPVVRAVHGYTCNWTNAFRAGKNVVIATSAITVAIVYLPPFSITGNSGLESHYVQMSKRKQHWNPVSARKDVSLPFSPRLAEHLASCSGGDRRKGLLGAEERNHPLQGLQLYSSYCYASNGRGNAGQRERRAKLRRDNCGDNNEREGNVVKDFAGIKQRRNAYIATWEGLERGPVAELLVRLRRRRRRDGKPGNMEPVLDDVRTIKRRCGLTKEREAPTVLQQESSQVPDVTLRSSSPDCLLRAIFVWSQVSKWAGKEAVSAGPRKSGTAHTSPSPERKREAFATICPRGCIGVCDPRRMGDLSSERLRYAFCLFEEAQVPASRCILYTQECCATDFLRRSRRSVITVVTMEVMMVVVAIDDVISNIPPPFSPLDNAAACLIRKHRLMMGRNIVSGGPQLEISPVSFSPASADRTSAWLSRPGKGGCCGGGGRGRTALIWMGYLAFDVSIFGKIVRWNMALGLQCWRGTRELLAAREVQFGRLFKLQRPIDARFLLRFKFVTESSSDATAEGLWYVFTQLILSAGSIVKWFQTGKRSTGLCHPNWVEKEATSRVENEVPQTPELQDQEAGYLPTGHFTPEALTEREMVARVECDRGKTPYSSLPQNLKSHFFSRNTCVGSVPDPATMPAEGRFAWHLFCCKYFTFPIAPSPRADRRPVETQLSSLCASLLTLNINDTADRHRNLPLKASAHGNLAALGAQLSSAEGTKLPRRALRDQCVRGLQSPALQSVGGRKRFPHENPSLLPSKNKYPESQSGKSRSPMSKPMAPSTSPSHLSHHDLTHYSLAGQLHLIPHSQTHSGSPCDFPKGATAPQPLRLNQTCGPHDAQVGVGAPDEPRPIIPISAPEPWKCL
ncbi:uncharacterized protein CLUP02_17536 [Colletotrichum lupini]|uniref:Uncharacterized protein n=1 Tax=Colletotrichum lupini TaxID=145971 RepID=A0A9Q8WB19_9PEZI|nr:uncharacterized protein CLUP02_17536 [Colletotrichum lupini]UQC76025.1 hypothetical protein CLUP02_17536 [Colletotrichum lupini]